MTPDDEAAMAELEQDLQDAETMLNSVVGFKCVQRMKRALALAKGAGTGAQWQPISTAPKDGTNFLAIDARGQTRIVHWIGYPATVPGDWGCSAIWWLPLPPPPAL